MKVMIQRVVTNLILLILAFFLPWPLAALLVLASMVRFGYAEWLAIALAVDLYYGVSDWPYCTVGAVALAFLSSLLRPRFSFYTS